ncbi:DNA polymerase III subunit alpha [Bacillus cereus]|uniref:DNA polymerase III subunit alpha n=1 Tax=Bacillus cereus TaxID=1396 RepID=UPI000BFC0E93|nr:DNA polymerase III subunit alpha [Bacillus cereus]PGV22957.1 DNA polymerase III subunit alpha [Bacillus cereus]
MCRGCHLHVHSEESILDGLAKVKQLVAKAKSIGTTALGITDHGVCGAIPDFIAECLANGIKPIPGCEVYTTKNRLIRKEEMAAKRIELCKKYMLTDKKGKPKLKVLRDFIRKVDKDKNAFDEDVHTILKDYLMSMGQEPEQTLDLFSVYAVDLEEESAPELPETPEEKIEAFRKDIIDYIDHGNFHMVLLAINNKGLEDLYEIVSDAHINGFYSDPRTDLAYIRDRGLGNNIIATSACLGSYFSQLVLAGRIEEAKEHIKECKDTFHEFYLEKQATEIPKQLYVNAIIDQLAAETNTPKILTTDVHYANKEDNEIHDVLVTSSIGKCIDDESRLIYAHEFWMKTEEEMLAKCNDIEAWENTMRIADKVNVTLPKEPLFPKFIVDGSETVEELLRKKAWDGLFEMALTDGIDVNEYSKRLQYELDVICSEGFQDYFLIEEDMIDATVKAGFLVGPGRGSGAGSLVCRCLKITWLDPIKYDLLFERFLNPERAGYPDLDVDYSYEGTRFVLNHMKQKYGTDKVAQIGTKGTLAARAVCRRTGKTLGFDAATKDAFAKAIPSRPGITLKEAYAEESMVQQYAQMYPKWWEAMLALEGHISQVGVHAGGIVLSPEPLTKVTPLRTDSEGIETTQYDMVWIEKLLVKFDVLKVETLDVVKKTLEFAGLWGKMNIYRDIDINDPLVFERVYNALNLSGIFQCESDLFKKIISEMKPNSFEDISVIVALGRPGPLDLIPTYVARKWGREEVKYPFNALEPVLKETYGVWVYQEQIMQASRILGGLTLGQSDMIRKGVSKKKHDLMNRWIDLMIYGSEEYKKRHAELVLQYPKDAEGNSTVPLNDEGKPTLWVDYDYAKQPDVEGAINRGFDEQTLLQIKIDWIKFGNYCFNKAHSAAYAMLSVVTAWLKCYYPVEFMAALLTFSEGKKDKNNKPKNIHYMKECEEMGITILPPDINESMAGWTPIKTKAKDIFLANSFADFTTETINESKEIRYGLSSIAGVSGETVDEIIHNRPYKSVEDMLLRVDGSKVNKTKVTALIKSGSFDNLSKNRNLLLRNYMQSRNEEYENIPKTTNKGDIVDFEKECFGVSITIKSKWEKLEEGKSAQFTGVIRSAESWKARTGKTHYTLSLETQEEVIMVTVWGYLMEKHQQTLRLGNKVTIKGEKSRDKLTANSFKLLVDMYEVEMPA